MYVPKYISVIITVFSVIMITDAVFQGGELDKVRGDGMENVYRQEHSTNI